MSSPFVNARCHGPIGLTYYPNEYIPFDELVIQQQLLHHAAWLSECANLDTSYIGPSPNPDIEEGLIKVVYQPHSQMPEPWVWAWSSRKITSTVIEGSRLLYSQDNCHSPEKFAGILGHEIFHSLGSNHWNRDVSMMNNDPSYLHYSLQSLYRVEDMWNLSNHYPGPYMHGHPSLYDYGNPDSVRAKLFIPALMTSYGQKSVLFDVSMDDNGNYLLLTDMTQIRVESKNLVPVAYFDSSDILHIPVMHIGNKILIKAKLITQLPSHTIKFLVTEIGPQT